MLDALNYNIKVTEEKATVLDDLGLSPKEYLVTTVHRASNTDSFKNLSSIVNTFCDVDIPIVFPVHPRTEKYLSSMDSWINYVKM